MTEYYCCECKLKLTEENIMKNCNTCVQSYLAVYCASCLPEKNMDSCKSCTYLVCKNHTITCHDLKFCWEECVRGFQNIELDKALKQVVWKIKK